MWTQLRSWPQRVRDFAPRTVLVIGFALFLLYGFPGYMSTDSVTQLVEARTVSFSDGHPPLMAVEWMLLDGIVAGPLLMLCLQGVLFLGGLYTLLRRMIAPRAAAWAAIGILLFPPVLTPMAVIWKDSQMAAYLIAGTAAIIDPRQRVRVVGVVLIAIACVIRHNAFAAGAPLIGILFEWRNPIRWWKRLAMIAIAAVLAFAALLGANRVLAQKHIQLTPVFQDLVGMIAFSHERSDEQLRYVLRGIPLAFQDHIQERARRCYELGGVGRVLNGGATRVFDYPQNDEQWAALYRAWKELALTDPGAYLASHWDRFRDIIGLNEVPPRAPVWNLFLEDQDQSLGISHNAAWSSAQRWIAHALYWLSYTTPLFRPCIYVFAALLLIALWGRDRLSLALFASGVLYELSFFPAFAESDYRYSHWMITSSVIACVIVLVQRRRRREVATS